MTSHSRFFLICCWLVVFSLAAAPLAAAGRALASAAPASPAGLSTAALRQLPGDPAGAVPQLVEQVFGPDETQAQAAVSELLRRAGLPLVSISGPVTALPDELVLADAAVYSELVPDLTRAVRRGDFYTPDELAGLLYAAGYPEDALPVETLVAGLGQWGKAPGAARESQYAAIAVRTLAGRRLQVFFPGTDLDRVEFDPLQTVLILAHATSDARPVLPDTGASLLDRALGVTVAYAQGDCDDLERKLTPKSQVEETIVKFTKDGIVDAWKEFALSEGAREALGKAGTVYERGSAILNVLLLMMGAQIDLSDNRGGQTHYKHKEGDRSEHVKVMALAYFDSNIAKQKVACYKLAGIDVPPPGPLKDFKVRWSLNQSMGTGYQPRYLAPIPADSRKLDACGSCGEMTGADGRSTIELFPPVEENPGSGHELSGSVRVIASLDKNDFPFKMSDLLGLNNPAGFAIGKTWDLVISALSRAGLPSKSLSIRVDYHGSEIYTVKGKSNMFLFYIVAPIELDLVSCTGLEGPWEGKGGLGGDTKTFLGDITEDVFDVTIPENVTYYKDLSILINPDAVENRFDIIPEMGIGAVMSIDPILIAANRAVVVGDRAAQPVGEVEIEFANAEGAPLGIISNTTYPVYKMPADPRCPSGGYYFENYP